MGVGWFEAAADAKPRLLARMDWKLFSSSSVFMGEVIAVAVPAPSICLSGVFLPPFVAKRGHRGSSYLRGGLAASSTAIVAYGWYLMGQIGKGSGAPARAQPKMS